MSGDYENNGRATRPSFIEGLKALKGTNRPPKGRVELLAQRYAQGRNLWTGELLKPADTIVVQVPDEDIDINSGINENPIMQTTVDEYLL